MSKLPGWIVCLALALVAWVGPWFFGAWEMWWFWPFAALIGVAMLAGGWRLAMVGFRGERLAVLPDVWCVFGLAGPFLVYAFVRSLAAGVVWMDAERMVLLHATGGVTAAMVAVVLEGPQRRFLFRGLFVSLTLMGLYGLLNHLLFDSRLVLWVPRYEQYAGRATGPYFCPDHFAGAMELLFCMSAACLLDRGRRGGAVARWGGVLSMLLAVAGILLSKSRGAGMTLVAIVGCILVWGFVQWPRPVRWHWRMITVSLVLLMAMGALMVHPEYVERFTTYGGLHQAGQGEARTLVEDVVHKLQRTSRGRMFGGAWRAWKTAPWIGIGPGMHQHLWPRFAASADGDREQGVWPTLVNDFFHSYEVHSDWLQLLEEFGVFGMLLFLLPAMALVVAFVRRLRDEKDVWASMGVDTRTDGRLTLVLGGWLALAAMAFHSLGDFNLQMPGTVWMLAVLLGLGLNPVCAYRRDAPEAGPSEAGPASSVNQGCAGAINKID